MAQEQSLPEMTLSDFIEDILEDYDDSDRIKCLFTAKGFTFRVPPSDEVIAPRMDTPLQKAVCEVLFATVHREAEQKLRWYKAVKAAGFNTMLLNEEQISHVLNFC